MAGLDFRSQRLELRGAPATLFTVDVDLEGRRALVAVLASTDWGEVGTEEPLQIDETGAYVDVLTVVPTLFDRGTLVVHLAQADGRFATMALALELPDTVHALLPGPSRSPLLAWTDDGISTVELRDGALQLVPAIEARAVVAGGRGFISDLTLTPDLDGDGERELLLTAHDALHVHLSVAGALGREASGTVPYAPRSACRAIRATILDGSVALRASAGMSGEKVESPAVLCFREVLEGAPARSAAQTVNPCVCLSLDSEEWRTLLAENTDLVQGLFRVV